MPFVALTINCYQCKSSETIECSDVMINMPDAKLKPESCDHVFEAEYCIKSTSLESNFLLKLILFLSVAQFYFLSFSTFIKSNSNDK